MMVSRKFLLWLALILTGLFVVAGCDGILFETPRENGRVDRLRIDGGEDWDGYDITPRYQSKKPKDQDGYYMMLKSEKTF